ncbi:hypothetical protein RJ640_000462 [Escallonia rubra]|uniref:DUF4283 domain-containing protein n=1 Tax=Escallonia rubra TaxID=112253 RepID=A0AA88QHJ0_9ASTE|nr:hypothetical protein RJ640_000462 [Escallonia rubra]
MVFSVQVSKLQTFSRSLCPKKSMSTSDQFGLRFLNLVEFWNGRIRDRLVYLESPHSLARYGRLLCSESEVIASRQQLWVNTLIGQIYDSRQLSASLLQRVVDRFWNLHGNVLVELHLGRFFAIHFVLNSDLVMVLKDNPWNVRGKLLILQCRKPLMALEQIEFSHVDLWVQFHHVTLELYGVLGYNIDSCRLPLRVVRDNLELMCLRYAPDDRIGMLAFRDEPCFTVVLRAFANTNRNHTTRIVLIDSNECTDVSTSVDSSEDLIVEVVNLAMDLDSQSPSLFANEFFLAESSYTIASTSDGDAAPEEAEGGVSGMVGGLLGGDDNVAVSDSSHVVHIAVLFHLTVKGSGRLERWHSYLCVGKSGYPE